jgi:hypothetical protein
MRYEWSQWFRHDGKGCPVPRGVVVNVDVWPHYIDEVGQFHTFKVTRSNQKWPGWSERIRYRVRRPLVSEWLAETTSDLPVTEDA